MSDSSPAPQPQPHKRRPRYSGKNPRRFEDKYKEHQPERYADTVAKVIASGKTPAGQHLPIMVEEILQTLDLQPGMKVVDCTLGYGGHAKQLLDRVLPGGTLLGLDQDPIEIVKTEARLRTAELPESALVVRRTNFAALHSVLSDIGWQDGADAILADLGLSSMQIDNPTRGFSFKNDGPLDMRMNPQRGAPASVVLERASSAKLADWLRDNADEPHAEVIAAALAGQRFTRTKEFQQAILACLPREIRTDDDRDATVRRVFQALRIEVNGEFSALDTWLRLLPQCLKSGGRIAVLTFHSGEDRRVKKAFQAYERDGIFAQISDEVGRAAAAEVHRNPRASSAKLRWAIKA